ncbi:MAG: hypothetical protein WBE72_03265 [Terracidiphilus sp.]
MRLANENAATAFRVLNKCCEELKPEGPWRWRCAAQNGTRLPIAASLEEGFLHLACRAEGFRKPACTLEHIVLGNSMLAGGAKLALSGRSCRLHLTADIAMLEEEQVLNRLRLALDGFHDGHRLLKSPASCLSRAARQTTEPGAGLGELLRETAWTFTERGANDFSAELDAHSAPPARIRISDGVVLSLELVRSMATSETSRRALALFLLTATGALRLARAYAEEVESGLAFGIEVHLPTAPAVEEIDHALAALSIARRVCARETNVLLNEAAARRYLAARNLSNTNAPQSEKEN